MIESWRVNPLGYASGATQQASSGVTPFGFSITNRGFAIVAEAGSGAVSSYETHETGGLEPLSRSIPLGQQKAPCWLATTGDGQYAYTANAGSGTISSLAIASDGEVQLLNPVAGVVAAPFDLALSRNSRFLYVRQGAGAVSAFRVAPDGSLSPVGTVTGLPVGAQGIAAR
jgi:6-phosphogluconolactonase (cycloisomerase 2 family)